MPIEQCNGCIFQRSEEQAAKVLAKSLCRMYDYPELQHTRLGGCAARPRVAQAEGKDFVDPLKKSKKMAKGIR